MDKQQHARLLTRREALKRGVLGAAGLAMAGKFARPVRSAPVTGKAKSVIQIWMWGGPCHIDTFDPKPQAGNDYCGPLESPIKTNVGGIQICELLPLLAQQADKYSIIQPDASPAGSSIPVPVRSSRCSRDTNTAIKVWFRPTSC